MFVLKGLAVVAGLLCVGLSQATASELTFYRGAGGRIELRNNRGALVGSWVARNNVMRSARPYPPGTWRFSHYNRHRDDNPNSAFGSYGIFVFDVPGRSGMGVHSGRANSGGPTHPTLGCIRTTDAAMRAILALHRTDPITRLVVR